MKSQVKSAKHADQLKDEPRLDRGRTKATDGRGKRIDDGTDIDSPKSNDNRKSDPRAEPSGGRS